MRRMWQAALLRVMVLLVWLPSAGLATVGPPSVHALAQGASPTVGGVELATTLVAGWPLHYDLDVPPAALATASAGFEVALTSVPRKTELPAFVMPMAIFLLADQARFRAALQEIGGVRIELVALEIGGYTIERDGTMLIFFPYDAVDSPTGATLGFAHELAHLAVREASARRPVPQWFNEGFAQWASYRVLADVDPDVAGELRGVDRALVASAIHSQVGLLPWASLVSRTQFSRSGTEGWAGLAYGQGTLFVDWLERRHGVSALGVFLRRIGDGAGATQAFSAAFQPFDAEEVEFQADLRSLVAELRPGLHRLTEVVRPGRPVLYAVIGGSPGESISIETFLDGEPVRPRERTLDPAGFDVIDFPADIASQAGSKVVRVTVPSLGVLEAGLRADGAFVDGPTRRIPAPVQIPGARQAWFRPAA